MIKDLGEYSIYFQDLNEDKKLEREFLISIVSKINPDTLKFLVSESRK